MAAARHGAAVDMIGCLGDDEFGTKLRQQLQAAGVNLDHLVIVPQGSGMSVALVDDTGDYAAVVVSGANRALDETKFRAAAEPLARCRVLLLQHEIGDAANEAAARLARAAGATVVLNAAPAKPLAAGLDGLVDILVVNAIEADMLGGGPVTDLPSAVAAARRLLTLAPTVIVTAGAHGVAAAAGSETLRLPAHPVAHAQTHGAGDVFVGVLAARLAESLPLAGSLHHANAAAARHVGTGLDPSGRP